MVVSFLPNMIQLLYAYQRAKISDNSGAKIIAMTQAEALKILKTGANVFLTGEPGSGKTFVTNEYVWYLKQAKVEVAVTASTGIAATHLGGRTVHSWSGIGVRTKLDKYDLDRIASTERIVRRIENAHILIVDEISMLSADTLSMIDAVCREVRRAGDKAFGGLQAVFVGDFFQLPPVTERGEGIAAKFAYESPAWAAADPAVCYLTEQYRQDDLDFLTVLKAIRSNAFGDEHKQHILARKTDRSAVPDWIPRFFPHNAEVDRVNEQMLEKLAGSPRAFEMAAKGPQNLVQTLKKGCLSPEILLLKPGAAVMFTKNSPKAGFVNGTLGIVKNFDSATGLPRVRTRSNRTIVASPVDWSIEENGRVRAKITQLPLRLAWAITVHKSQGISLDAAAMDLSGAFEYGQGYVALSRVRSLSGLHIFGWNEKTFQVHPEILARDFQFRQASDMAKMALAKLSPPELRKIHQDFAARIGGQPQTQKEQADTLDTYTATLVFWKEGKTVSEIAAVRELKESTILSHIEKLSAQGKLSKNELSRLLTPDLARALPEIRAVFQELKAEKLSPVYEKFAGKYSYDDLRIARMML